jgi:hypothetical protein
MQTIGRDDMRRLEMDVKEGERSIEMLAAALIATT